jgi:hypothetical protein
MPFYICGFHGQVIYCYLTDQNGSHSTRAQALAQVIYPAVFVGQFAFLGEAVTRAKTHALVWFYEV